METDGSSGESKQMEKPQDICEEEEREGEVLLVLSKKNSIFDILSRGINLYVYVQLKADESCEDDNNGDEGIMQNDDGKQSSEEGGEGKNTDTPKNEEKVCGRLDPQHASEELHDGKSQLQFLKTGHPFHGL